MKTATPTVEFPQPRARERYDNLMQLMGIADRIKDVGWRVDRDLIASHQATAAKRIDKYRELFIRLTRLPQDALGTAGAGKTKRVREYFLVDCKAPVVSRDKDTKKAQVNTSALVEYATRHAHTPYGPAAAALYGLRKNIKATEFCTAYDYLSRADGRIHSSFFPYGTKTGRWTSSSKEWVRLDNGVYDELGCNLQQVPSKEPTFDFQDGLGPVRLVDSLRDIFIADEGCLIHSYDYEALELRLIAYIFGAKKLIANLAGDPHTETAKGLFKADYGKPGFEPKRCRTAAKSCAYGFSYSMNDPNNKYLQTFKTLKESFPKIKEELTPILAERFFEMYPEIKDAQLDVQHMIDKLGYRELATNGRRLHYPKTTRGYNQAINFTFQGTGAELINRAICALDKSGCLSWNVGGNYVLGQIHDELVLNVREEDWYKIYSKVTTAMEQRAQLGATIAGIPAKGISDKCWPK